jgi:hypothetical protein
MRNDVFGLEHPRIKNMPLRNSAKGRSGAWRSPEKIFLFYAQAESICETDPSPQPG